MDVPSDYVLQTWQQADPILWRNTVPVPDGGLISAKACIRLCFEIFGPGKGKRLQTWARDPNDPNGPHWIGVRHGIGMHTDPRFPRFTHQLIVFNDGWGVTGFNRQLGEPLAVGTLYCVDTHSPHQVIPDPRLGRGLYYLAASMDAKTMLNPEVAGDRLLAFVHTSAAIAASLPVSASTEVPAAP